jgi:nucleotide-binding universal stress UspA family protein
MITERSMSDRSRSTSEALADTPHRILVALHGHEPPGWEAQVRLAVNRWPRASVRLLGVIDPPTGPFTGLLPGSRRIHGAASRAWRRIEEDRINPLVDALREHLPMGTETAVVPAAKADPGRTIALEAAAWGADLVVVGPDRRSGLERRLLGAIPERVVAHARCGVLVTPGASPADDQTTSRAGDSMDPSAFGGRRPVAAGGEA